MTFEPIYITDLEFVQVRAIGDPIDPTIDEELNGPSRLTFALPVEHSARDLMLQGIEVRYGGRRWFLVEEELTRPTVTYRCDEAWVVFADHYLDGAYEFAGWPSALVASVLAPGWSVGTVEMNTGSFALAGSDTSYLDLQHEIAWTTDQEVEFDSWNRLVHLRLKRGAVRGVGFEYGRDLTSVVRRSSPPVATRLWPYGQNGLSIAYDNDDPRYVENFDWYIAQGLDLPTAEALHTRGVTRRWDAITVGAALQARAEAELAKLSQPTVSYELSVVDLTTLTGAGQWSLGDTVPVRDVPLGIDVEARIVRLERHPRSPANDRVELSTVAPTLGDPSSSRGGGGSGGKPGQRTVALVIAAADSMEEAKQGADLICSGTDDQDTIQLAVQELLNRGGGGFKIGAILLREGTYTFGDTLDVPAHVLVTAFSPQGPFRFRSAVDTTYIGPVIRPDPEFAGDHLVDLAGALDSIAFAGVTGWHERGVSASRTSTMTNCHFYGLDEPWVSSGLVDGCGGKNGTGVPTVDATCRMVHDTTSTDSEPPVLRDSWVTHLECIGDVVVQGATIEGDAAFASDDEEGTSRAVIVGNWFASRDQSALPGQGSVSLTAMTGLMVGNEFGRRAVGGDPGEGAALRLEGCTELTVTANHIPPYKETGIVIDDESVGVILAANAIGCPTPITDDGTGTVILGAGGGAATGVSDDPSGRTFLTGPTVADSLTTADGMFTAFAGALAAVSVPVTPYPLFDDSLTWDTVENPPSSGVYLPAYGLVTMHGMTAPRTITLPEAATLDTSVGWALTIKDADGDAGTHTITIAAYSGETIDGAASVTISTNYGVLRVTSRSDGTGWVVTG